MTRIILPVLFGVVVLATGVAHGLSTGRWGATADVTAAVERMAGVPRTIDYWRGEDLELDAGQVNPRESRGSSATVYQHSRRPAADPDAGVAGPARSPSTRPTSATAARRLSAHRRSDTGAAQTGQFWPGKFPRPNAPLAMRFNVFWAWSAGDGWRASNNPRLEYARRPALYKLYLIREVPPSRR